MNAVKDYGDESDLSAVYDTQFLCHVRNSHDAMWWLLRGLRAMQDHAIVQILPSENKYAVLGNLEVISSKIRIVNILDMDDSSNSGSLMPGKLCMVNAQKIDFVGIWERSAAVLCGMRVPEDLNAHIGIVKNKNFLAEVQYKNLNGEYRLVDLG